MTREEKFKIIDAALDEVILVYQSYIQEHRKKHKTIPLPIYNNFRYEGAKK